MNITTSIVNKLLNIIKDGIQNGAGEMDGPGTFCIQQAVSAAIGTPDYSDRPICVHQMLQNLGIGLNDTGYYWSDKNRGNILRRLAVAELGTEFMDMHSFEGQFVERWNNTHPDHTIPNISHIGNHLQDIERTKDAVNIAVQILVEMNTPGSRFLYLCDPTTPQSHKDQMKRLFCVPQLEWRGFNAQSDQSHIQGMR